MKNYTKVALVTFASCTLTNLVCSAALQPEQLSKFYDERDGVILKQAATQPTAMVAFINKRLEDQFHISSMAAADRKKIQSHAYAFQDQYSKFVATGKLDDANVLKDLVNDDGFPDMGVKSASFVLLYASTGNVEYAGSAFVANCRTVEVFRQIKDPEFNKIIDRIVAEVDKELQGKPKSTAAAGSAVDALNSGLVDLVLAADFQKTEYSAVEPAVLRYAELLKKGRAQNSEIQVILTLKLDANVELARAVAKSFVRFGRKDALREQAQLNSNQSGFMKDLLDDDKPGAPSSTSPTR